MASTGQNDPMIVFCRKAVRRHRQRAAGGIAGHDFLLRSVGEILADRLDDVRRRFPTALDLGCHHGVISHLLNGRGGIERLIQADLSVNMVRLVTGLRLVADEEALPFKSGAFDLVISLLSMHWVNDLPGALAQIRSVLKPDGLFLAAMLGGRTLKELRQVLAEAEIAAEGGMSPRVSPFADVRDAGNLLGRAGFALSVADLEVLTISYPDAWTLLRDLRGMGETNAALGRRPGFSRRATLLAAIEEYHRRFAGADGRVPATFEVIFLTGWAPDPAQPRSLKPGSARTPLAAALARTEAERAGGADEGGDRRP